MTQVLKRVVCASALLAALGTAPMQVVQAQSLPAPAPPTPPSCEVRLAVWQEQGAGFIRQLLEMEAQNRDLRAQLAAALQHQNGTAPPAPQPAPVSPSTPEGRPQGQ
jgi:hypothetical protein